MLGLFIQLFLRKLDLTLSRNSFLSGKGVSVPRAQSTGTTIVGCMFKDGIVLGADTRATNGDIVADKNCEKVRQQQSSATIDDCSYASPSFANT